MSIEQRIEMEWRERFQIAFHARILADTKRRVALIIAGDDK